MRFTNACLAAGATLAFALAPFAADARVNVSEKGYYVTDDASLDIPRPADGAYLSGPYATHAECEADLPQNEHAWCNYYFTGDSNMDPPPPWPGVGYYIRYNNLEIDGQGRFDSQDACEQARSALGPFPPEVTEEMSCDYVATDPSVL